MQLFSQLAQCSHRLETLSQLGNLPQSATEKVFDNTNTSVFEEENNPQAAQIKVPRNQGCLNNYFTKYNFVRLPRKYQPDNII